MQYLMNNPHFLTAHVLPVVYILWCHENVCTLETENLASGNGYDRSSK